MSGCGTYCLVDGISPSLQKARAASTRFRWLFSENPSLRKALPERKKVSRTSSLGVSHSILTSWSTNPAPSRLNSLRAAFNVPSSSFLTTLLFQAFGRVGSILRAAALNLLSGSGRAFQAPCTTKDSPASQAIALVPTFWMSAIGSLMRSKVITVARNRISSPTTRIPTPNMS